MSTKIKFSCIGEDSGVIEKFFTVDLSVVLRKLPMNNQSFIINYLSLFKRVKSETNDRLAIYYRHAEYSPVQKLSVMPTQRS